MFSWATGSDRFQDVVPFPPSGSEAASTEVVIAGAGPVGLFLGCILRQNGIDVVIVDPHITPAKTSPASVSMPRTLEVLNLVNVGAGIAAMGRPVELARIGLGGKRWHGVVRNLGTSAGHHSRHQATCISQARIEAVLLQRYKELGGRIFRGSRLVKSAETADGIEASIERSIATRDGTAVGLEDLPNRLVQIKDTVLSACYLVGCDGESSQVRANMGVTAVGHTQLQAFVVADMEVDREEEEAIGWNQYQVQLMADWQSRSYVYLNHLEGNTWRIYVSASKELEATEEVVRAKLEALLPPKCVPKRATFGRVGSFTVGCKLAEAYRKGRSFLAGDAAHRLSPAASQGMNTGLQEAANLGWKITARLKGQASDSLLDTYEQERRQVAKGILLESDLTYRYLTGENTCAGILRLLALRIALCCLPAEDIPPASVKESVFGLSVSYTSLGTCWEHGVSPPHEALQAGNRLPDLPCCRMDGTKQYLLDVLKTPPCNAYHVLFVMGKGGEGAARCDIEGLCKESSAAMEPVVAALGARFPLATSIYVETQSAGSTAASTVLVPAPDIARSLPTLLQLPAHGKAILMIRPDGYIASAHRGDWNTDLWAHGLAKTLHPAV
mmetsp:Transcript_55070/g.128865  ORF Transcript_55070/g.128865 Transcript_55070/m.128865 type:complete len:614 (-) Transcript_55070:79-1920(-)